jgi:dTDP-4-dehydrorhamnose reductase
VRLLIVGAGQLGVALAQSSAEDVLLLDRSRLDVTDLDAIAPAIQAGRPDVVINATAYNRVDEAESRPETAFLINAVAPGWIARATAATGAVLVHVSTDYVFAGTAVRPYTEDDLPEPRSVYGAGKLAGEHLVHAYAPDALVVRTSGLFGVPAPSARVQSNFVRAIIRQAERGTAEEAVVLRVVDDQIVGPTYACDLADAILRLVQRGARGTIHVTNSGSCSWYAFARAIVEATGLRATVLPISTAERKDAAHRPAYSVLDHGRLNGYGIQMPHWRDALRRYLRSIGYADNSATVQGQAT